jgi:hypothetical protein
VIKEYVAGTGWLSPVAALAPGNGALPSPVAGAVSPDGGVSSLDAG